MAVVFCVRGDSFDARYSSSGKTPALIAPVLANVPVVAASAITGVIGGSVLDFDKAIAVTSRYAEYIGRNNTPAKEFSVLIRLAYGSAPGLIGVWSFGSGVQGLFNRVMIYNNGATLNFRYYDFAGNLRINLSGAWTATIDTIYDIVVLWDGTTSANAAKVYVDNVLIVQGTSGLARPADDRSNIISIELGCTSFDVASTRIKVNEFVIWNEVIDPNSVVLSDLSSAALNGATRTLFVNASSFDAQSYSDPGITNVKLATNYIYAGSTLTGSMVNTSPGITNVKLGTNFIIENSTLTGSMINTNPGASNVKNLTSYIIENSTYTGSLVSTDPGIANVRLNTSYIIEGSTLTGSLGASQDPGITNVRLNTTYIIDGSTLTGSLSVPTPASGSAGTVDLNNILEQIRYVLDQANTTTASPIDLSQSMTRRVQFVSKIHPLKIPVQPSLYPFVTCYITDKTIQERSINKNMLNGKRRADVSIDVVGAVWNNIMSTITSDPADQDCHLLMENIEYTLRAYDNLGGAVNWHFGESVKYYDSIQETTHLRAGVMALQATIYY